MGSGLYNIYNSCSGREGHVLKSPSKEFNLRNIKINQGLSIV